MKVLVTGGRKYKNINKVRKTLAMVDSKKKITLIIHGDAAGSDTLCDKVAEEMGIPTKKYPITKEEWDTIGKSAGPKRNCRMLDENPDIFLVIAFPGNNGTSHMVRYAKSKKYRVLEVI